MDGGPIMPSQLHRHYGRLGGSLVGGHRPPLCSRTNELHPWEHWYGLLKEDQVDMCGVPQLMCGRRMGEMGNDECNAHILRIWHR